MALDRLRCPKCSAPVPLVTGEHGTCPFCREQYPIPDTYRALRDEARAEARRPEAQELVRALGKPPPWIVRVLAIFATPWFIMLGLGFWIAIGIAIGVIWTPRIGRAVFHVNTYDVLSEGRQMQLAILLPLATVAIGIIVSGWARKRGIKRGGLQAALAASPPEKAGGPKTCRQCGAPLATEPQQLAARCAYCHTDNLVEMPEQWVAKMRSYAHKLSKETNAAAALWATERRALRKSLVTRLVLVMLLLVMPMWFIMGAAGKSDHSFTLAEANVAGPPRELPDWSAEVNKHWIRALGCKDPSLGYRYKLECRGGDCAFYRLVPLLHGDVVTHMSPDLPSGSQVELQMHDMQTFGDAWVTTVRAPISADQIGKTRVPYSGWYRLRITVPAEGGTWWTYCATVR